LYKKAAGLYEYFFMEEAVKNITAVILAVILGIPAFAGGVPVTPQTEGAMSYCTRADLTDAYGEDYINGWSRQNPETADRAIRNAEAEIDGYLLSGGYAVPVAGPPETIQKYCIDIAAANLVISRGVLQNDPGGNAVIDQAKAARRFLEKVAEGKFRIPGFVDEPGETARPPSGGVRVSARSRLDWRGY
jgi:phage gp36-like protein